MDELFVLGNHASWVFSVECLFVFTLDVDASDLVFINTLRIKLLTQGSILSKNDKLIGPHSKLLPDLNDQLPY